MMVVLIGAGSPSIGAVPVGPAVSSRYDTSPAANTCGFSKEIDLENQQLAYNLFSDLEKKVSIAGVVPFVAAAAGGCAGGLALSLAVFSPELGLAACLGGASLGLEVLGDLDLVLAHTDFALVANLIIHQLQPIFLDKIEVSPPAATLSSASPKASYNVLGTAVPKASSVPDIIGAISGETASLIVEQALKIPGCTSCQKIVNWCSVCGEVYSKFVDWVVGAVAKSIAGHISADKSITGAFGAQPIVFGMGSRSVSIDSTQAPGASVSLACRDGDVFSVTRTNSTITSETVVHRADHKNLLLVDDNIIPSAKLSISVNNSTPTINTDRSSYGLKDTVIVNGNGFAPSTGVSLFLQGIRTTIPLIASLTVEPDGTFRQPVAFPTGTAAGLYSLVANSTGGAQSSSASIRILTSPIAHFTMSSGGHSASDGGLLAVSVAPNESVTVTFDGRAIVAGSGSIVKLTSQSNGSADHCNTLPYPISYATHTTPP